MKGSPSDKALSPSEEQDFLAAVKRLGFDPNEFAIEYLRLEVEDAGSGQLVFREQVTVKRKATGRSYTYSGGHGNAWAAAADLDVASGKYGKP